MKPLNKKLLRDLWRWRTQLAAIALVIGAGVATYVMSASTAASLHTTRADFYRDTRFADVFAVLKRAPRELLGRVREIPGVGQVRDSIMGFANVRLPGFPEPVVGEVLSWPDGSQPSLNRLYLVQGRYPQAYSPDEVVISEQFASAHGITPGQRFSAVLHGHQVQLRVVGIVLSPEFIYQIQPGGVIPDFQRFVVIWMNRSQMETAYDMKGAFNSLALRLAPRTGEAQVISELDRLLHRYGGQGAYGRDLQTSNRYLTEEFRMLGIMAVIFPAIFFSVAAFLLHVVLGRLVETERGQIAILKACGYTDGQLFRHYLATVLTVALLALALGEAGGIWLGHGLSQLYMQFYRFPRLDFQLPTSIFVISGLVVFAVAATGAAAAIWRVTRLPPAVAMSAEAPASYRQSFVEALGLGRWLGLTGKMVLRNLQRRPLRAALTLLGLALACSVLMTGRFQKDAIDFMINVQFKLGAHEDLYVSFTEPADRKSMYELRGLPGVRAVEGRLTVPVDLSNANHHERSTVTGLPRVNRLRYLLNRDYQVIQVPGRGLLLSRYLAEELHVGPGDRLRVHVLDLTGRNYSLPVVGVVDDYVGTGVYMNLERLQAVLGQGPLVNAAMLRVDRPRIDEVYRELRSRPGVLAVHHRQEAIESLYHTLGDTLLLFSFFNTLLASTIAVGVVYNSARVALSERGRELASLRVLGMTHGEISVLLLSELAIMAGLGIGLGFVIGRGFCWIMANALQTEMFRVPVVIEPASYGFAGLVMITATLLSSLSVWHRLGKLNLADTLQVRE